MDILQEIDKIISQDLKLLKGLNKQKEIKRLIFEIFKKYNLGRKKFLNLKVIQDYITSAQFNYHFLKKTLIRLRYPEACKQKPIKENNVYLPELKSIAFKKKYKFSGKFIPEKIYIERSIQNNDITRSVMDKFPDAEKIIINKLKEERKPQDKYIDTLGKDILFLVEEKFDIFKHCPCTKNVFECDYYILNIGFGCPYDCTFCYLQHYTNSSGIILPVNIPDILSKLKNILKKSKKKLRIGTGEFTDSLIFEDIIPYSEYLIPFFKDSGHILEMKTKSINIENILKTESNTNVVISWSLNTPSRIKKEEYYTPLLKQRLEAARKCIKKGYKVGFHFDPIIYYDKWEEEYYKTIGSMFEYAKDNIEWISLGALRFHCSLKQIIEMRFPNPEILDHELLIAPGDKKLRYTENIRIELFRKMTRWIREFDKKVIIYLCMEEEDIWQKVFNSSLLKKNRSKGIDYLSGPVSDVEINLSGDEDEVI